ncbi:MAG: DUF4118 domain-containing protein [Clostridia bacterium]|nr:DUF4118 domain-containing protein [Clostridia bacterium]
MTKKVVITCIKDSLKSFLIIDAAAIVCILLNKIDYNSSYLSMVFILAVFLVSRFTNGYAYGIITSLISVFLFNYFFTYPYYTINVTLAGYPITLCVRIVVVR